MLRRISRITYVLFVAVTLLTVIAQNETQAGRRVYKLEGETRLPAISTEVGDRLEIVYQATITPDSLHNVIATLQLPNEWAYVPGTATQALGVSVQYSLTGENFTPYETRDARAIRWVQTASTGGEVELSAIVRVINPPATTMESIMPEAQRPRTPPKPAPASNTWGYECTSYERGATRGTQCRDTSGEVWGFECTSYQHGDTWGTTCREW